MLNKLKSRKLWTALLGIATGLAIVFGVDTEAVNTVSGAVVAAAGVIAYIVTEGKIDMNNQNKEE